MYFYSVVGGGAGLAITNNIKKNTQTGDLTNPNNFDLNKNLYIFGTWIILVSGRSNLKWNWKSKLKIRIENQNYKSKLKTESWKSKLKIVNQNQEFI